MWIYQHTRYGDVYGSRYPCKGNRGALDRVIHFTDEKEIREKKSIKKWQKEKAWMKKKMILIRSRLGFVVASLAVAFICWAVVYLPPYEKIVYEKNPIVSQEEYDKRFGIVIGYKGGTNIKKIYSVDDIRDEKGFPQLLL